MNCARGSSQRASNFFFAMFITATLWYSPMFDVLH